MMTSLARRVLSGRIHPLTSILAPLHFAVCPETPTGALFCLKKLSRATHHYYLVSLTLMTAWGLLMIHVLPAKLRWLKLEFYIGAMVNHLYTTGIDLVTKRIYREETCKGQGQHSNKRRAAMDTNGFAMSTTRPSSTRTTRYSYLKYWWLYCQTAPKELSMVFAGAYVQVASRNQVLNSSATMLVFAIVSLGVKLLIQELAKVYVMRRGIRQIWLMCMLLGLPTVLIDTQLRVVMLLGGQSSTFAAGGLVAMALCEITMRDCKMWLIKHQIRQRRSAILRAASTLTSCVPSQSSGSRHERITFSGESATPFSRFEKWRQQLMDFHTAEIMADMDAEYIAIGCSASILNFFSDAFRYKIRWEEFERERETHSGASCGE
ncbi:hypothetical protein Gpo141_00004542 [Globisporangium polare]